jgi:hypothetical protein
MHSYRLDSDNIDWEVFFDDGAPDSMPRVLRTLKSEWHAMQLVSFLNGGPKPDNCYEWLFT